MSSTKGHPLSDEAPLAPSEFVDAPSYPTIEVLRRHGSGVAAGAGIAVFAFVLSAARHVDAGAIFRGATLGTLAAAGVKNLSELNSVIAETLLPQ